MFWTLACPGLLPLLAVFSFTLRLVPFCFSLVVVYWLRFIPIVFFFFFLSLIMHLRFSPLAYSHSFCLNWISLLSLSIFLLVREIMLILCLLLALKNASLFLLLFFELCYLWFVAIPSLSTASFDRLYFSKWEWVSFALEILFSFYYSLPLFKLSIVCFLLSLDFVSCYWVS